MLNSDGRPFSVEGLPAAEQLEHPEQAAEVVVGEAEGQKFGRRDQA